MAWSKAKKAEYQKAWAKKHRKRIRIANRAYYKKNLSSPTTLEKLRIGLE